MAIHFNQSTVAPIVAADGVARQPLLNERRVPGVLFALDRLTIPPGGHKELAIAPGELAWFQMIAGTAAIHTAGSALAVTANHIGLLPPGFAGTLVSDAGATLLLASVPDAEKLDPSIGVDPPPFRVIDWKDEPLLQLQGPRPEAHLYRDPEDVWDPRHPRRNDHLSVRHRVPGASSPGRRSFHFFLAGQGTCYAGADQIMSVRPGDVVYYHDLEPHWVKGGTDGDLDIFGVFCAERGCDRVGRPCEGMHVDSDRAEPSRWPSVSTIEKHAHSHLADV